MFITLGDAVCAVVKFLKSRAWDKIPEIGLPLFLEVSLFALKTAIGLLGSGIDLTGKFFGVGETGSNPEGLVWGKG